MASVTTHTANSDSQAVSVAKRTVAAPPEHSVVIDGDGDGLLAVVPAAKREPHTQKWRNALETNINISYEANQRAIGVGCVCGKIKISSSGWRAVIGAIGARTAEQK